MPAGASWYQVSWKILVPDQGMSTVWPERKREVGTPGLGLLVPLGYCQGFKYGIRLTNTIGHC